MPEGLRRERRTESQQEQSAEVSADLGVEGAEAQQQPSQREFALAESIDFWQARAQDRLAEARKHHTVGQVQESLDALQTTTPTPIASTAVAVHRKPRTPSITERVQRGAENMWRKYVEKVKDPEGVRSLSAFLDGQVDHQNRQLVDQYSHPGKAFDKRVAELRRQGYEEDFNEYGSDRRVFKKRLQFGQTKPERIAIGELQQSVEHPREALLALKAVGIQFSASLFADAGAIQPLCELAKAIVGLEDLFVSMGSEASWKLTFCTSISAAELNQKLIAHRATLEQLRSREVRQKLFALLQHQNRVPRLDDLSYYTSVLATPRIMDSVALLSHERYEPSEWQIERTLEKLKLVDAAGGSEVFEQLAGVGLRLGGQTFSMFDDINSSYVHAEDKSVRAAAFVESVRKSSEALLTEEGKEFLLALRAMGCTVTMDNLQEAKTLLPFRREAIALLSAAQTMNPSFVAGSTFSEIRAVVESPARLQAIVNPGYAQFVRELFAFRFLQGADQYYLRTECLGFGQSEPPFVQLYQNPEARAALVGQPHAVELFDTLRELGMQMATYNFAQTLTALGEVAREGAADVVRLLVRLGAMSRSSVADVGYYKQQIHVLCLPANRSALADPRLEAVYTRMREFSTGANRPMGYVDIMCEAVQIVANGADVERFENAQTSATVSQFLLEVRNQGKRLLFTHSNELLQLDERSGNALTEYVALMIHESDISLKDLLLFSQQRAVVDRGLERARTLYGDAWAPKSAQVLYEIGAQEDWSANAQVIELLSAVGRQPSAELVAAACADVQGLLRLEALVQKVGGRSSLGAFSEEGVLRLLEVIPHIPVIEELLEDDPLMKDLDLPRTAAFAQSLTRLQSIDRSVRRQAIHHLDPSRFSDYGYTWREVAADILQFGAFVSEHPTVVAEIDRRFGPDWTVRNVGSFISLTEENVAQILDQTQAFADYGLPAPVDAVLEAKKFIDSGLDPIVKQLKEEFGYQLSYEHIDPLADFVKIAPPEGVVAVIRQLHADFGLSVQQIISSPITSTQVFSQNGLREAFATCRSAGITLGEPTNVLTYLDQWKIAAEKPDQLAIMISLHEVIPFSIDRMSTMSVLADKPEVVDYIKTSLTRNSDERFRYITGTIIQSWIKLSEHRAVVEELESQKFSFGDIYSNADYVPAAAAWNHPDKWSVLKRVQDMGEQVSFVQFAQYKKFVDGNMWNQFVKVRETLGMTFADVLKDSNALALLNIVYAEGFNSETLPRTEMVERQLNAASVFRKVFDNSQWQMMDHTGAQAVDLQGERVPVSQYFQSFVERYGKSGKGKTLLTLLAAREYRGQPFVQLLEDVAKQAKKYEAVLQLGDPNAIPEGFRVSMGMEYEITSSTAKGYRANSGDREMRVDISRMSSAAGIPQGRDAYYEIAAAPTDNPYALLLEMKLLQDLGYVDFNFASENYDRGAHGFHLTLGGEKGISANSQTQALQNMLILTGWAGVCSGREAEYAVAAARGSALRERGAYGNAVQMFANRTEATEFRGLSIDQWEPFERTVLTAHLGGIAIQVADHALSLPSGTPIDAFVHKLAEDFPESPNALYQRLCEQGLIQKEIASQPERDILYAWLRLQSDLVRAVEQHNTEFLDTEMYGYEDASGSWVEPAEFGGENNAQRFASVAKGNAVYPTLESYAQSLRIPPDSLFKSATPEFVNALTRTSNIFLKPAIDGQGDVTNALAVLQTTKLGNSQIEQGRDTAVRESVLDRGRERKGYYAYQGGSERMIIHAAQRSVLRFNDEMRKILKPQQVEANQTAKINQAA